MISITPNWHPVFVHFTIALYTTAALLFAVHVATAKISWSGVALTGARVNLWIGAAVTIITVAAGIHAFLSVPHSEAQAALMVDHRNWAIATAIIWWIAALWAGRSARRNQRGHYALMGMLLAGMIPLLVTAGKGAELVYRYGVGGDRDASGGCRCDGDQFSGA